MKNSKRFLSVLIAMCMILTVFSFAPGAFAQTEAETAGTEESSAWTEEAGASDEVQPEEEAPVAFYNITTSADPQSGGTVTADKTEASEGDAITYKVVPAEGYKTVSIKIGDQTADVTDAYGTTAGIFTASGDVCIAASFEKLAAYKITTSVNSTARGTITASSSALENGSKTITAKAKSGYYLSDLLVDGKSVGEKYTYTLEHITANHTVKAVFSKQVKVMLDAGHFGTYNRSPVYSSYYEAKAMWTLHKELKSALEDYNGFYVGLTRSSQAADKNVYYRGTAADGYDLLLSLHSNSSSSRTTDYPLIITQKGNTGDPLAKKLGKAIETTMKTGQAYKVWQKLNSDGNTEYYGVLRGSKAVGTKGMIVEHSFHTNLTATKWLSGSANLKKLAAAEAKVLADHYGMLKKDSDESIDADADTGASDSSGAGSVSTGTATASKTVKSSQKVKVTVSSLNMRKSYSTSAKSMGKAKKNTVYQLKAKTKDGLWGQLKTNGYWIYLKGYTKVVTTAGTSSSATKPAASSKTVTSSQKVKVTVSSLNMRKSYSTGSKAMGKTRKNTVYQLKAKTKDGLWGQLKTNGYWIYLKGYTKVVSSKTTVSATAASKVAASSQKVKVTVSSLNMRKSYSTGSKSMGKAVKNKVYQLKAKTKDGNWGQLKSNGYWIYLKGYTKAV